MYIYLYSVCQTVSNKYKRKKFSCLDLPPNTVGTSADRLRQSAYLVVHDYGQDSGYRDPDRVGETRRRHGELPAFTGHLKSSLWNEKNNELSNLLRMIFDKTCSRRLRHPEGPPIESERGQSRNWGCSSRRLRWWISPRLQAEKSGFSKRKVWECHF